MHFSYATLWDKGDFYSINQDSFALQSVLTGAGPFAMALVCDGVGGLSKGEYAGGLVAKSMTAWFYEHALVSLCQKKSFYKLFGSFKRALAEVHEILVKEGQEQEISMGTTITMLLLGKGRYYVFHVGDSGCYKIRKRIEKLTKEQTDASGKLLYAVGVGDMPSVWKKRGSYGSKDTFLLGSDGLVRCLTPQALQVIGTLKTGQEGEMRKILRELVRRGRSKGERDNCTGIVLKKK